MNSRIHAALLAAAIPALTASAQHFIGPTPYLCAGDSPWPVTGPGYYLETFEDGILNTPGVTGNGHIVGHAGNVDSVDCDDGVIDGRGNNGHSYYANANPGIIFTFNAAQLGGRLPEHVGIVWTDGVHNSTPNAVHFEAYDAAGNRIGGIAGTHADSSDSGQTAEDRFYGVEYAPGIAAIHVYHTAGCCGVEVDHLQYGFPSHCPADFNGDGFADGFDYDDFVNCFETQACPPGKSADFNGDGFADGFDYDDFVTAFETGC